MAKNDISLNINTKFNGEGLKRLDEGMKQAAKGARTASQAMSAISGELGQIGGSAGKATSAISGMMSALAAGGPMALVIGGITAAIGFVVKAFNDAKEAAKEAAEAIRTSFASSFENTKTHLSEILGLFARLKKEQQAEISERTTNANITAQQATNAIQSRHIQARSTMTNEYDYKRDKASETREIGQAKIDAQREQSKIGLDAAQKALSTANGEVSTMVKALEDARRKLDVQLVSTVDEGVKKKLEEWEKNVADWANGVRANGKDAVAYTKKVITPVVNPTTGSVSYQETEVQVTYKEALEAASKGLSSFRKENEDAIKNIDAYNQRAKDVADLEKQLKDKQDEAKKVLTDYNNAKKNAAQLEENFVVEQKKLEEAYKEEVREINKKEQRELKQKQSEEAKAKAEEDRKAKAKKRAELEGRIADKEKENEVVVDDLKKQGKALAEREKVLAEELKKAEDAAKGMKAGFDVAGEIAQAIGKDNPWKSGVDTKGGVNQWIADNRRAQGEANKEIGRINANKRAAKGQQGQLAGRVFDENGNIKTTANLMDVGRFADVSDFLGGKGVSNEQRAGLQAQADKLRNKFFDKDGNLKRGINPASRDLQQLKKIEGLLGKFKKLDEVKKKQEELKKVEAEKQRIQGAIETNTKDTKDEIALLRTDIKKLAM